MIKRSIIYIILSLISVKSFSQKIDFENFNPELLSEFIEQKINLVRDSLNLKTLVHDNKLTLAAQMQVIYCIKNDELTHYQKKEKYHDVRDRVDYYNGVHESISENLASQSNISDTETYDIAADKFVKGWIKSKGHFKNLSTPIFERSGVAISINKKNKTIVAAQVFGSFPIEFDGYSSPANAYNLGDYDNSSCKSCRDGIDTLRGIAAYVENNKVYLSVRNLNYFNKIFRGSYYFAADIILKKQFACGANNVLHSSPYHDGYLLPIVSKSDLIKRNLSKTSMLAEIGVIPFPINEDFECNLIVVKRRPLHKKNPVCVSIIPSNSYGANLNIMPPTMIFDTLNNNFKVFVKHKMKFTIPFEKDKYEFTKEDIQVLYDSLELNKLNIKRIKIIALASVEGEKGRNQLLQKKRAESILKILQGFQLDSIKTKVRTAENWKEFRKEVAKTKYAYLLKLSEQEIKTELKKETIATDLEPLLSKHRKAMLYLQTVEKITDSLPPSSVLSLYQKTLNDSNSLFIDRFNLQKKVFAYIASDKISLSQIDNITIPQIKENIKIINNRIALKYMLTDSIPTFKALNIFDSLAQKHPKILFNLIGFKIQHWYDDLSIDINQQQILKTIKRIYETRSVNTGEYYKMMINYHIAAADYYRWIEDFKKEKKATRYVLGRYMKAKLSPKDALILANFLVYHGMIYNAAKLLKPFADKEEVKEDLLFYYLSIIIYNNGKVARSDFDDKMEKAIGMNKSRFCGLFGRSALTFQLMRNPKLKGFYCDNCNEFIDTGDIKSIIGDHDLSPNSLELGE